MKHEALSWKPWKHTLAVVSAVLLSGAALVECVKGGFSGMEKAVAIVHNPERTSEVDSNSVTRDAQIMRAVETNRVMGEASSQAIISALSSNSGKMDAILATNLILSRNQSKVMNSVDGILKALRLPQRQWTELELSSTFATNRFTYPP